MTDLTSPPQTWGSGLAYVVDAARRVIDEEDKEQHHSEYGRGIIDIVADYFTHFYSTINPSEARERVIWWLWKVDVREGHERIIESLREQASTMKGGSVRNRLLAAAGLLECHDSTGINLATFGPVGDFVNDMIHTWYDADVDFRDNGV